MQITGIIEGCSGIRFWNSSVPHTFLYVREFCSCCCCIESSSLEGDAADDLLIKSVLRNWRHVFPEASFLEQPSRTSQSWRALDGISHYCIFPLN